MTNKGQAHPVVRPPPPPPRAAQKTGFFGSPLGMLAIVVGAGVIGGYALDWHKHTCESCGRRWSHFGAFNLGDEESHTCSRCGEVQWWKCGARHVLRGAQYVDPPAPMQEQPQPQPAVAGYPSPAALPGPSPYPTTPCPVHGHHAHPAPSAYPPYPAPQSALPPPAVAQYPTAPRPSAYPLPIYPPRRRLT